MLLTPEQALKLPPELRAEALELIEADMKLKAETKLFRYRPYAKQKEFHLAGGQSGIRERLLKAGNQLGKSFSGSYEAAMHLTGEYPDWWQGRRFPAAVTAWAASITSQVTRDTVQRLLLGTPGNWGTGAIPKANIVEVKRSSHGVADAVDSVTVKHKSGGLSRLTFKAYDQGREKFQGETLNFVWFDEEPPLQIYTEGLTRVQAIGGFVWITFTPLLGMSDVVKRFLIDKVAGTHVTNMTIYDAEHYTEEQRKAIIDGYPAHEREARANGTPMLGSGRIFPIDENELKEDPFTIPDHWPRIAGIDFGWQHPTAAVWVAWDKDNDVIHVYDCYRVKEASVPVHAMAIKTRGDWIPVAWPHDGLQHDKGSGETLADQYRRLGVKMLPKRAEFEGGGNGVEAGVSMLLERMQLGKLKIARHLHDLFEEIRLYHRDEGKIVKLNDDAISALRYAVMMLRKARMKPSEQQKYFQSFGTRAFEPFDSSVGY